MLCISLSHAEQTPIPSVTILADPSLTLPITEIARNYARDMQVSVSTAFGSSKTQSMHIGEGTEADVFISARTRYITGLQNQGLIDVYSLTSLARNRLVLAGAPAFDMSVSFTGDIPLAEMLAKHSADYVFALGDAEYIPSGSYALDALYNLSLLEQIEPRLVLLREEQQLHDVVSQGNFGFVYATTALQSPDLRILHTVPDDSHKPIIYQGVVVAGENMSEARKFLDHLRSGEAQAIFDKYGFLPSS